LPLAFAVTGQVIVVPLEEGSFGLCLSLLLKLDLNSLIQTEFSKVLIRETFIS
jgi:hypothetical protein